MVATCSRGSLRNARNGCNSTRLPGRSQLNYLARFGLLAHRASAAFRACVRRSSAERFFARALPPSRPSFLAAAFRCAWRCLRSPTSVGYAKNDASRQERMLCLALCTKRMQSRKQLVDRRSKRDFVFPHSNDAEARTAKLPTDAFSPRYVRLQLRGPILSMSLWQRARALRAAMPKAAVDKKHHMEGAKHEIRSAGEGADIHLPAANPGANQRGADRPLCGAIAGGAHAAHSTAPLALGQDVHAPVALPGV
jgi:hypothetical protein